MKKILIISTAADMHAQAVMWGLRQHGHNPVAWSWASFPEQDQISFAIGPAKASMVELESAWGTQRGPFDVVWMRRLERPQPMPGAHPDDVPVILRESSLFLKGVLPGLGHAETRWVNEMLADDTCDRKPFQLQVARDIGFRIPDTLISNNVSAVRRFLERHGGRLIHKPLSVQTWDNADGSRTTSRTSLITASHLTSEYSVRACPAIYQEVVEKLYELRVTVMGDQVLAAAIDSQRDEATIDWRCDGGDILSAVKEIKLEPALARRCVELCRALGLAFGCIDLIVPPHGDVVFLEINSAGQFLFKELADPGIPMLDSFCRFLTNQSGSRSPRIAFSDFLNSVEAEQTRLAHHTFIAKRNTRK